ncbi:hypothetical protein N9L68_05815 [bacterium]|nr:hypothetical protein [bacterium]
MADARKNASEETLEEMHPEQRGSYISGETWKLIKERHIARQQWDVE